MSKGDFASMMEAGFSADKVQKSKSLRTGEVVEGTIVQIGRDSVFVDVGATTEARIDRTELEDKQGNLQVKIGDKLRASVASVSDVTGPVLVMALGRGQRGQTDVSQLAAARESGIPVEGTVSKAVKGGLEVQVAGIRAFCPASQVDLAYIADLAIFEGQTLQFKVVEIKEDGRSVVLSRKALLEAVKQDASREVLARITVGGDYEGVVSSLQKYGAFIDLGGGVEGLVHVSEIAHRRIEQVQDVLSVGEKVLVRVLALEPNDKSPIPKLRLSLRAMTEAPVVVTPEPGEVLTGKVNKHTSFGIFVETPKGSGLVPLRELGIVRGADHRKFFPIDSEVKVVLVNAENGGKLTFSVERVASVEERQNFRDFARGGATKPAEASSVGSFGDLLRQKLNLASSKR
ncbi:MAG: hypothetical protein RJA70_4293 [Pseudomonadota bacterium]|jgi:small subunit ribosomal protein S1